MPRGASRARVLRVGTRTYSVVHQAPPLSHREPHEVLPSDRSTRAKIETSESSHVCVFLIGRSLPAQLIPPPVSPPRRKKFSALTSFAAATAAST